MALRPNLLLVCTLVVTMALAACGEKDEAGRGGVDAQVVAETPTAAPGIGPLEGSYKVTLGRGDVKRPLDVKRSLPTSFTVRFLPNGGVNNEPIMLIHDDRDSVPHASAGLSVEGDSLTLATFLGCEATGLDDPWREVEAYTFELSGDTLRLKKKAGATCFDGSVESILTTKPLRRRE